MTNCANCNQTKIITVATEFGRLCYTCFFAKPEIPAITDQNSVPLNRDVLNRIQNEAARAAGIAVGLEAPDWPDELEKDVRL